jgi:hypothetical protein
MDVLELQYSSCTRFASLRLVELDTRLQVRAAHDVVELAPGRSTGVPRMAAQDGEALITWVEVVDSRPTVRATRVVSTEHY